MRNYDELYKKQLMSDMDLLSSAKQNIFQPQQTNNDKMPPEQNNAELNASCAKVAAELKQLNNGFSEDFGDIDSTGLELEEVDRWNNNNSSINEVCFIQDQEPSGAVVLTSLTQDCLGSAPSASDTAAHLKREFAAFENMLADLKQSADSLPGTQNGPVIRPDQGTRKTLLKDLLKQFDNSTSKSIPGRSSSERSSAEPFEEFQMRNELASGSDAEDEISNVSSLESLNGEDNSKSGAEEKLTSTRFRVQQGKGNYCETNNLMLCNGDTLIAGSNGDQAGRKQKINYDEAAAVLDDSDDGAESLGSSTSCSSDFEINRTATLPREDNSSKDLTNGGSPGAQRSTYSADVSTTNVLVSSDMCVSPTRAQSSHIQNIFSSSPVNHKQEADVFVVTDHPRKSLLNKGTTPSNPEGAQSNTPFSKKPETSKAQNDTLPTSAEPNSRKPQRINPFLPRAPVADALEDLDTALPQFDFDKLERQLTSAMQERKSQMQPMDADLDYTGTRSSNRPAKMSMAARLKAGNNLQLCFVNNTATDSDCEDAVEQRFSKWVPKSKSAPDFDQAVKKADDSCSEEEEDYNESLKINVNCQQFAATNSQATANTKAQQQTKLARSASNGSDATKRASELRNAQLAEFKDPAKRQAKLEEEAKLMLMKAKIAAQMQMEVEKQAAEERKRTKHIEELVGVPILRRKLTRFQLTKMNITQLQIIANDMHSRIEVLNDELVKLLIGRDNLHMEQDSLLVDVEDLLQYHKCEDLKLPDFLVAAPQKTQSRNRLRIFKR